MTTALAIYQPGGTYAYMRRCLRTFAARRARRIKAAAQRTCRRGHLWTAENTLVINDPGSHSGVSRRCRACFRIADGRKLRRRVFKQRLARAKRALALKHPDRLIHCRDVTVEVTGALFCKKTKTVRRWKRALAKEQAA